MRVEVRFGDTEDAAEVDEVEVTEHGVEVGSEVAEGDMLLEVATDKVTVEIAAPQAGRVVELPVGEGETVAPMAVLAVLETTD